LDGEEADADADLTPVAEWVLMAGPGPKLAPCPLTLLANKKRARRSMMTMNEER